MRMRIKQLNISTGWPLIAIMREKDARKLGLHPFDRVRLCSKSKQFVAMLDITDGKSMINPGEIGLFTEVLDALDVKKQPSIEIYPEPAPKSLQFIKKKLDGEKLCQKEFYSIIKDIAERRLSEIEMAFFVSGVYSHKLDFNEIYYLTKAMIDTGDILKLKNKIVVDKHCIGGVPGNRTTMIVVPIIAANGLAMPKTSSRAITSAAGTADTMEVLANVNHDINSIEKIVTKTNGCIVWGGGVSLAPSDDQIIRIERPLSIDAEGQLLASVIAKKASVSVTHLLIDIPFGDNSKVTTKAQAVRLARQFGKLTNKLNIKLEVMLSDGSHPIGNGVGPALEAIDVMKVLHNDKDAPRGVRTKALYMASLLLELTKKAKPGEGIMMALKTLTSGNAYDKMNEIIDAQGRKVKSYKDIKVGKYKYNVTAVKHGKVKVMENHNIARIARILGAPEDKGAGLYLHKHIGDNVSKGDRMYTIYAEAENKMADAKEFIKDNKVYFY